MPLAGKSAHGCTHAMKTGRPCRSPRMAWSLYCGMHHLKHPEETQEIRDRRKRLNLGPQSL